MAGSNRDLTIRFLGDSKGLVRAAKDAISGLDDTETKAQAVAKALVRMANQSEAEMRDAASAADALGASIGDELRADIERAGGSIDGYVADLRRAGLTYDEIRADADALGDALKRTAQAGKTVGDDVKAGAAEAETGIARVRTESDNSRSVLANMVGNSTQDLGALGGVAGTAGMALGQLAEYATEGNISLKGLSSVAGPMLGVAAAVILVNKVVGDMQKASEDAKKEIANLRKVQDDLADGKYEDAAKTLAEQYKNTAKDLEKYGYSAKDVVGAISGQGDVIADLNVRLDAASEAYDSLSLAAANGDEEAIALQESYGAQTDELGGLIETMGGAQTEYAKLQKETAEATGIQKDFEDALKSGIAVEKDANEARQEATEKFRKATTAAEEYQNQIEELYGVERTALEAQDAWAESVENLNEVLGSSDASLRSQKDAALQASEAYATMNGATLNSEEGTRRQIESLFGLASSLAPDSPLRKALVDYIGQLAAIPAKVDTQLNLNVRGATVTVGGDTIGQRAGLRAKGGPVSAGQPYLVGEQGPELVVPSGNGTVIPAGKTASMMGGNTTVNIYTNADPNSTKAALRRFDRRNGPGI